MRQTERLYDAGLRRFCFENVWGYVAKLDIALTPPPETAAFSREHKHQFLNADELPSADALAGEMQAFESGWGWFQKNLQDAGFEIIRRYK